MISGLSSAAFSQTDAAAGKPRIELFWSDYRLLQNKLSAGARKALENEARSIFAEAGIELSFLVGSPEDHGGSDAQAIRVILMPRSAEGWTESHDAMGAVLERNARARTLYVFVPVVERTIGHSVDDKMLHDGRKAHALARPRARPRSRDRPRDRLQYPPRSRRKRHEREPHFGVAAGPSHHVRRNDQGAGLMESLLRPATARTPRP